jgi:hypothetical protein
LKDEYKEEFAREMGLFGGANGFTEWMNLNTHPTCRPKVGEQFINVFFVFMFYSMCILAFANLLYFFFAEKE